MIMLKYRVKKFFKSLYRGVAPYFIQVAVVVCVLWGVFFIVNDLVYGRLIWENAYKLHKLANCQKAIDMYEHTIKYLKLTDFIKANKKKYIAVQHRIALCYLELEKYEQAESAIKEGMYLMMDTYGLKSEEYAHYLCRHVVDYYIKKDDYKQAKDYLNLAEYIYLKNDVEGLEFAFVNKLNGDLYAAVGRQDVADKYYLNALRLAEKVAGNVDLDELIQIYDANAQLCIKNKDLKQAVILYTKLKDRISKMTNKKEKIALIDWKLGNAYKQSGDYESALMFYNVSYDVVEKMPSYYSIKQQINELRSDMIFVAKKLNHYSLVEKLEKLMKNTKN